MMSSLYNLLGNKFWMPVKFEIYRGHLVCDFKQHFSVFKQHYTYFHTFFHSHIFLKNINNVTRTTLSNDPIILWGYLVWHFKQHFSVFKQYYMHFHTLFHQHVFSKIQTNGPYIFFLFLGFSQCILKAFNQRLITIRDEWALLG